MNTSRLLKSEVNKSKHLMGIKEETQKPETTNSVDTITMDVPLFIRMLEYAKEDAKTDMDLHVATEKALELLKKKDVLCMDSYDYIVSAKSKIKEGLNLAKAPEKSVTIPIPDYVFEFANQNHIVDVAGFYRQYVRESLNIEFGMDRDNFEIWAVDNQDGFN
jgi:hypothetical protein